MGNSCSRRPPFGEAVMRRRVGFAAMTLVMLSCSAPREDKTSASEITGRGRTVVYRWGSAENKLGFRSATEEHLAFGASAIALGPGLVRGDVLVLDAVGGRVVRAHDGELATLAEVPKDCDDLAASADGALAVRRSVNRDVLVYSPAGQLVGKVDTSAVGTVDTLGLGTSRRVIVGNPFQETFTLGSPSVPQLAAQVQHSKREGAAFLASGAGVSAVRTGTGEIELRVVEGGSQQTRILAHHSLGRASAARVVGASGTSVCVRLEHVTDGPRGALVVDREVACLDALTGRSLFREKLPAITSYALRRELSYAEGKLVFAHASEDGLAITTWTIDGGTP